MTYFDGQQQSTLGNPQFGGMFNPQSTQTYGHSPGSPWQAMGGLGQAAYGQQYGQFGQGSTWGQHQLSQQDISELVRQITPTIAHILAQTQQSPMGYAAYGQYGPFGQSQRLLSPQDINEVVRQLLPILPQIVGMLQGQPQFQHTAMYGGLHPGAQTGFGPTQTSQYQNPLSQSSWPTPFQQQSHQQPWGQFGWPQAAFGGSQSGTRQLTQQDVTEVARQLVSLIPQVIGNLQAYQHQRVI